MPMMVVGLWGNSPCGCIHFYPDLLHVRPSRNAFVMYHIYMGVRYTRPVHRAYILFLDNCNCSPLTLLFVLSVSSLHVAYVLPH